MTDTTDLQFLKVQKRVISAMTKKRDVETSSSSYATRRLKTLPWRGLFQNYSPTFVGAKREILEHCCPKIVLQSIKKIL